MGVPGNGGLYEKNNHTIWSFGALAVLSDILRQRKGHADLPGL